MLIFFWLGAGCTHYESVKPAYEAVDFLPKEPILLAAFTEKGEYTEEIYLPKEPALAGVYVPKEPVLASAYARRMPEPVCKHE